MTPFKHVLTATTAVSFSVLWIAGGMAQAPPVAPIRNVTDTHFGVTVDDPYRYMESVNDPDVARWLTGQSDYARALLDRIPGRASLLARMDEITRENAIAQGGSTIANVRRLPGDRYFYLKTQPPQDQTAKLYMRQGLDGREVLLVDPHVATLATGKPHVIDGYVPSFDGAYVAYGLSRSGAEDAVLHVIETATGKEVDAPIDRRPWAVNWRPDGRSFFYNRRRKLTPDMPATELNQRSQVLLHTIGQDADKDPVVFGIDAPPAVGRIDPTDIPIVVTSPASRWALAIVRDSKEGGMSLYAAPIDTVIQAPAPWRVVSGLAGDLKIRQLDDFAVHGDELFVITHDDALKRRVIMVNLAQASLNTATTVVPPGDAIVESIAASRDALYIVQRDGPMHQLMRVPLSGNQSRRPQTIAPPAAGVLRLMPLDPRVDGALLSVGIPPQVYAYDPPAGRIVDARLTAASDARQVGGLRDRARESDEPRRCARACFNRPEARPSAQPVDAGDPRGIRRVRKFPGSQSPPPDPRLVRARRDLRLRARPWRRRGTARNGTKPVTRRPSRTPGKTRSPWRSTWSPRTTPLQRGLPSKARAPAAFSSAERSRSGRIFLRSPFRVLASSTCFASKRRRTACRTLPSSAA